MGRSHVGTTELMLEIQYATIMAGRRSIIHAAMHGSSRERTTIQLCKYVYENLSVVGRTLLSRLALHLAVLCVEQRDHVVIAPLQAGQ